MTREEALQHFASPRYKGLAAQKALLQAPKGVVQALHLADLKLIHKNQNACALGITKILKEAEK